MNRWIVTALAALSVTVLSAPGCGSTGVGDPCTPDEEYDPTFQGFSVDAVSAETKSYQCLSRLCLVNHFQGRVTCPYGQTAQGVGPMVAVNTAPADPNAPYGCAIPGSVPTSSGYAVADQITASNVSVAGFSKGAVPPQLTGTGAADRTANKAVYCSCRCANVDGNTNDNATYCTCPENYTCTPLVSSIGTGAGDTDANLSGSYCVLNNTGYDPALSTNVTCDASVTSSSEPGYCPAQF